MPRKKKRYKVVGTAAVLGYAPGQEFEAAIDKTHEAFLFNIGAIEEVKKGK